MKYFNLISGSDGISTVITVDRKKKKKKVVVVVAGSAGRRNRFPQITRCQMQFLCLIVSHPFTAFNLQPFIVRYYRSDSRTIFESLFSYRENTYKLNSVSFTRFLLLLLPPPFPPAFHPPLFYPAPFDSLFRFTRCIG